MMALQILLFLAGLALIVIGADALVEGASSIAQRFGVSEFVIGLTIVGMGTSAPEWVVSMIGAFQGNADIAVGNVVGSNIFNTLLILGITAFILPMHITPGNRRKDIPVNLAITLLLIGMGLNFGLGGNGLSRIDGAILLALFAVYIWSCFRFDEKDVVAQEEAEQPAKPRSPFLAVLMILGGLAGLVFGGRLFVNSATTIARMLGVSDKFIAITILAGGTSMPELATCVVAAAKKRSSLALGNILGSNVFNVLLILGSSALITPLSFAHMNYVDLGVLLLSAILVCTSVFTGKRNQIDRFDGALLVGVWLAYMTWLFLHMG